MQTSALVTDHNFVLRQRPHLAVSYLLAFVSVLAFGPGIVHACLHPPTSFAGKVGEYSQEAIVFWNQGRQESVMRLTWNLQAGDDGLLPKSMGWVIPVPNLPDHYGETDGSVFRALHRHWDVEGDLAREEGTGAFLHRVLSFGGNEDGVEILEAARTESFRIQPLRATGAGAVPALNGWLEENGFGIIEAKTAAWYVERDWVFLCVRLDGRAGARFSSLATAPALQLSFASDEVVYPLKFSTHQGDFDVQLWIITEAPLVRDSAEEDRDHDAAAAEGKAPVFQRGEDMGGELADRKTKLSLPDRLRAHAQWMPLPAALDAIQLAAAGHGYRAIDNRVGIRVPLVTLIDGHVHGEEIAEWSRDLSFRVEASPAAGKLDGDVARGPEESVNQDVMAMLVRRIQQLDTLEEQAAAWGEFIELTDENPSAILGLALVRHFMGDDAGAAELAGGVLKGLEASPTGGSAPALEFDAHILFARIALVAGRAEECLRELALAVGPRPAPAAKWSRPLHPLGVRHFSFDEGEYSRLRSRACAALGRWDEAAKAAQDLAAVDGQGEIAGVLLIALAGDRAAASKLLSDWSDRGWSDDERYEPDFYGYVGEGIFPFDLLLESEFDEALFKRRAEEEAAYLAARETNLQLTRRDPGLSPFDILDLEEAEAELEEGKAWVSVVEWLGGRIDLEAAAARIERLREGAGWIGYERRRHLALLFCVAGLDAERRGQEETARALYARCVETRAVRCHAFLWATSRLGEIDRRQ